MVIVSKHFPLLLFFDLAYITCVGDDRFSCPSEVETPLSRWLHRRALFPLPHPSRGADPAFFPFFLDHTDVPVLFFPPFSNFGESSFRSAQAERPPSITRNPPLLRWVSSFFFCGTITGCLFFFPPSRADILSLFFPVLPIFSFLTGMSKSSRPLFISTTLATRKERLPLFFAGSGAFLSLHPSPFFSANITFSLSPFSLFLFFPFGALPMEASLFFFRWWVWQSLSSLLFLSSIKTYVYPSFLLS